MSGLEVIYSSDDLLAVDKPSGLLVHRGWGRDAETALASVRKLAGARMAAPVHRLDRGTSGVLLFALSADAARAMADLFREGLVRKRYLALVRGRAPEEELVDHPIPKSERGPRVPAATLVRRLLFAEAEPRHVSLVEAWPRTGRVHQVRRHLKHAGHPVLGDATYGHGKLNHAMRERYGLGRLALHAAMLSFEHPKTRQEVTLRAPLPQDLLEPLVRMGFAEADLVAVEDGGQDRDQGSFAAG